MRTRSAEVIALDEVSHTATLRFLDDSSERDVSVPEQIHVRVGMPVKVIEIPNDTPIYGWGSQPAVAWRLYEEGAAVRSQAAVPSSSHP